MTSLMHISMSVVVSNLKSQYLVKYHALKWLLHR